MRVGLHTLYEFLERERMGLLHIIYLAFSIADKACHTCVELDPTVWQCVGRAITSLVVAIEKNGTDLEPDGGGSTASLAGSIDRGAGCVGVACLGEA